MDEWTPGELRALAAYVLFDKGQWPGTPQGDRDLALANRTIIDVADTSWGHMRAGLTLEQLATVREHIADAVVVIDGEPYGAEL